MKKVGKVFLFIMVILAVSLSLSVFASTVSRNFTAAPFKSANGSIQAETGQTESRSIAQVSEIPVAAFTYIPEIPQPGELVSFDASASNSPGGSIILYTWDFGDGNVTSTTSATVTHSYPIDGDYTVQLTVTDDGSQTASSAEVVQVQKDINLRVCFYGTVTPIPNAVVTVYYNNGTAWIPMPARAGNPGVTVEYDNMTQPHEASQNRNPGFTASILLNNATNIEFDIHPACTEVYFKFQWGPYVAYWPNNATVYYRYDSRHGTAVAYNFEQCGQPRWDSTASAYVIKAANIQSGERREANPIIATILCPPPSQQWYLTLKTDPTGITTIPGQGWYTNGTSATLTAPTYVTVSSSSQYRLNYWDVDGTSRGSGVNPITVLMTANHTATAHYVLQYSITFNQTGLTADATGTVATVNGSAVTYSQLPYTLWADSGSSVTYSCSSTVASSVSGKQFSLSSVTGASSPITVSGAAAVTGNYVVQYQVRFAQIGLDSSASGTIVTVNGSAKAYTNLPYTFWAASGSSVTYSYSSPVASSSGKQFRLNTVSGPSSPLIVTGSVTVTGNYITQYQVTFAQTGLDSTASGTVVTVNGSSKTYSTLPYTSWIDSGSSLTYSYSSTVTSSISGKQFSLVNVTGLSSPITVTAPSTITGNYKTQYYLTVTSTYDSPTPATGWFDSGSSITESVTSPTSGPTGTRYVCTGWSGSGSVPTSGSASTVTFSITAPSSITWNWKTQYYLTVTSAYDSPSPVSGWFDSGSGITESVTSPVSGGSGIQYGCTGWTGIGNVPASGSGTTLSFTITQPSSVTWNWKIQYYLTVSSARDSPSPVSGWFDSGSGITESVTSPVSGGSGIQYVCTGWTGTGSVPSSGSASSVTFTISAASTITWSWKTQYQVTFGQSGVGPDFGGTVVSIDSVNYGVSGLSVSFWWDSGSSHSFSFASPLVVSGKQYVWSSTSGLSTLQSGTLMVAASGSVVGNYVIQNQITFDQVGISSDFSGTVVTIDSVGYSRTQLPISFSWNIGSNHTFAYQSPLVVGANSKQYIWTNTTGLTSLESGTITVASYGSIIGNYKTQYYLTVTSPYDSPSPSGGWFDSASSITETVTSPVAGVSGVQYVCTGWSGAGSVPSSGTASSVTFAIIAPSSITWNWKTQYYLTVTSAYDSPSPVSGWFDSGSGITASVTSPVSGGAGIQYVCTGWSGSGSVPASGSSSSVAFTINAASSVTWNWKTQYYLTVSSAYDSPSPVSGWFDSGSDITESVMSPVAGGSGVQYVCTGWIGTGSVPASGSSSSVTFTIVALSSITWNWKTQYTVTFSQSGLDSSAIGTVATVNGNPVTYGQLDYTIWVDSGTPISYSYNNVSSSTLGRQFILTGVSGLPSPVTVAGPMTITGNYKTQYQVTFSQSGVGSDFVGSVVTIDSSGYGVSSLPTSFWWDSGSSHAFSFYSPLTVNASEQYNWVSTAGLTTSQSGSLTVSGSGTVTGNYATETKFQITFTQTGIGADFTGTVVIIDGIDYGVVDLPTSFWWNSSAAHTFAYQSPLVVTSNVKQYVWDNTSGLSTLQSDSITATALGTVSGNYKTQYYLTLAASPSGVTSPSGVGWYDAGTSATVSTSAFVDIMVGSSRYRFNGWTTADMSEITSPLSTPTTVLIDKAKIVTATYAVQYNVTFTQTGVGPEITGTVVQIDGVNQTLAALPASFWWDNNTIHTFAFQSPLIGSRYAWISTTGLSTSQSGTLTILASGSVTGNYVAQYYLTVASPYGSPAPTSGWFNAGSSVTASVTSPFPGPAGTQYVCTGWSGTSSVPSSGSGTTVTFIISQNSTITWNWKTQYYLTVIIDPTSVPATIPGQGWYDASSNIALNAPVAAGWNFSNWDIDGTSQGSTNPITINMNAVHTATVHYTSVTGQTLSVSISPMSTTIRLGSSVILSSTVSGGTAPYGYQWYLEGLLVPGANASSWTFVPPASGVYHVYLKVTDASSNTAQSGTARIEVVATPPVGGLATPLKATPLLYLAIYMGLLVLLGAGFCLTKRKRK